MTGGNGGGNEPLKTATAVVGLLAGLVAAVYVLGGLVIALRLLLDHFSVQGAVSVVGQLPRESVITTAMLNVIGPAAGIGFIAAIGFGTGRVIRRLKKKIPEGDIPAQVDSERTPVSAKRIFVFALLAIVVAAIGVAPAVVEGWKADDLFALFPPDAFAIAVAIAIVVTAAVAVVGWLRIHRVGREERYPDLVKTAIVGAIWAAIAVVPMVMLSGAKPFESAQVCSAGDQAPTKGRLIGETSNRVLLEEEFGREASVVGLPSEKVTLSETGDLSSTLVCPQPAGHRTLAKVAEARLGPHGGEAEVRLAMALRPRLRFDSAEPWRPISVDRFVAERFPGGGAEQACWSPRRCVPLTGLDQLRRGPDAPAYIEIEGRLDNIGSYHPPRRLCHQGTVVDCNEGRSAVIYYRRTSHEGRWYWDYWWFYRFNDYVGRVNECFFYCADHEGDWEGVTVITTPRTKPEILGAIYAAHKDRVFVEGKLLPLSGGHPLAFAAEGTHATYPYRCSEDNCLQFSHLPEDRFDGEVAWGGNDDAECEETECVQPLPEVAPDDEVAIPLARDWAAWPGKWGSTCVDGCDRKESSPNSPGLQIRFRCPWAPTRWAKLAPGGSISRSDEAGDSERLLALCEAQRGVEFDPAKR